MSREDLELPPELAELVAQRRRVSRAPDAAKARLHRRLHWAFTQAPTPRGWAQRLLSLRLALAPAALVTYLPLAVAGIGLGVVSLSVAHVLSRRAEPAAGPQIARQRAVPVPVDPRVLPMVPPLGPLPESPPPSEGTASSSPAARSSAREIPPAPAVGAPATPRRQGSGSLPVPSAGTRDATQDRAVPNPSGAGTSGVPPPGLAPAFERQLLEQARRQLRSGAVSGALDTLEQHRRLYPEGQLSEEREVLVIEGTARFRGTAAARPMVDAFRQRFPRSPLLPALEAFLKADQSQSNLKGVP